MLSRARLLFAVGVGLLIPTSATAQGVWVQHQPPCKLSTGHYLVKGSMLHLKLAVESRFDDERASRISEAKSVLHQAILEKRQEENAAAWYYLGRAYTEDQDFRGADSAFRRAVALAPECTEDVHGYRSRLAAFALNEALRSWGTGAADSARAFFGVARSLDSADAEIPLYLSIMYASQQEPDSAARYLDLGMAAAETDTAHGSRLRQAALEVARGYESRAFQETPAVLTVGQTRFARDTTRQRIVRDSTLLDRIVTEVSGIRKSGARLNPQALAAFQRDSTLLETRLADARRAADSLDTKATGDSTLVAGALGPALRYYARFLERYPEAMDAEVQRLRLLAAVGDPVGLSQSVERVAQSPHATGATLVPAALSLFGDGQYEQAARLTEGALERNPNDHSALALATHVFQALGAGDRLMAVATTRHRLAPLDEGAARALAVAWDLAGRGDSAARWRAVADTGLGWNVRITQFQATEHSTSVNGYVVNGGPRPLTPITLVFEFLDDAGAVLLSSSLEIPALERGGRAPVSVRVDQGGAASWRYRKE